MKLPRIDTSDHSWAEADWPRSAWLDEKVNITKKAAKSKGLGALKKIASNKKVQNFIVDKVGEKIEFGQKVFEINGNTYRLTTDYVFYSYLFVGKKKALLIDTGLGIGSLYDLVKEITDKPLTVVLTHGHFNACGGAAQFDEVLVHKSDLKIAEIFNYGTRYLVSLSNKAGHDTNRKPKFVPISKKDLENGFDLGDRKIKVMHAPSHTRGSLVFYDDDAKLAVLGDLVTPLGFELLPFSLPLSDYITTMESVLEKLTDKANYCTLWPRALDYDYVHEFKSLLYLATLSGNDYNKPIKFRKSDNKKMLLFYYGPKTNKRTVKTRWNMYKLDRRGY